MKVETLYAIYQGAMREERLVRLASDLPVIEEGLPFSITECPEEVYAITWRLLENARSEFVSRSYNTRYNLTEENVVYESVAAHSNLMNALVTHALDFCYGTQFGGDGQIRRTGDGYTYREIIEVVRLHDLAENEIGDIPDNGDRDEAEKVYKEFDYFRRYLESYGGKKHFKNRVLDLLRHMYRKDSPTGRLLFLADKVSAFIATLCLDCYVKMPLMHRDSPLASDRDKMEMSACDYSYGDGFYRASEMWTMDFLSFRKHVEFDETMFFTGVLVMATLMVNGIWYSWRNPEYFKAEEILKPT